MIGEVRMNFTMKVDSDGKLRPKLNRWSPSQTKSHFDSHWKLADLGYKTPCWKWTGCLDYYGYGVIKFNGRNCSAHRYSAIIHHGHPGSEKLLACHKCDNPACVNPEHIYWGTHKRNTLDMIERGRAFHPRGEATHNATLTNEKVLEIRRLRAVNTPYQKIAEIVGASKTSVMAVARGRTWKHVL